MPTLAFKNLPPKYPEISIISLEWKGLNSLHISKQNAIAIMPI